MSLLDWFSRAGRQEPLPQPIHAEIAELRGDVRQLQLEWEETFAKIRRILATMSKRDQRAEQRADDPAPLDGQPPTDAQSRGYLLRQARQRYGAR